MLLLLQVPRKALKEAASIAAEAEMSQQQADETSHTAAAQALEQELDTLVQVGGEGGGGLNSVKRLANVHKCTVQMLPPVSVWQPQSHGSG